MASDVVATLRRQRAEQAEQEACDAELSFRQTEIMSEGDYGYRVEVTASIIGARQQAERARTRADRIKEHAQLDAPAITQTYLDTIEERIKNFEFQLVQQQELAEYADVYGLDAETQQFQVEQLRAAIQALNEWLGAHPKPKQNRAARRGRTPAEPPKADA